MLVARREPTFDGSAQNIGDPLPAFPAPQSSRLSRWVNVFQLVGSLLAVPVGLGSAYSLYRANFSPETTCQSLRAGIVSMLDKNVDAGTRRVLVRRDLEAFEQTCAAVDPDATKAFKALLAAETAPAMVSAPPVVAAPNVELSEASPKEVVRKAEPHPRQVGKQPAPVAAESVRREPAVSETQWLDAVRQAMATHAAEPAAEKAKMPEVAPVLRPAQEAVGLQAPTPAAIAPAPLAAPMALAPPPAIAPPAPQADADHPVPPAAIPDSVTAIADASKANEHHSRIGGWVAKIPLVGPVVENGRW